MTVPTGGARATEWNERPLLAPEQQLAGDLEHLSDFAEETARLRAGVGLADRVNIQAPGLEEELPKLVLALIEFLRRVLEKQAVRRMEAGTLTDLETERLGDSFVQLERKLAEMKTAFGLQDDDLNLNLGPLGNLLDE